MLRRRCITARRQLQWAEGDGWQPGYVGKGDGYGRFVNPDGSVVEGSCVRGQASSILLSELVRERASSA